MKKFFIVLFVLIAAIAMGGCLNLASIFPIPNVTPVIISEPIITATEDQLYSYQVEASDPNGDTLTYSFIIKPGGMNIDSENGLITWIPTNDQVGINQVEVEISDGKKSITQSFEIEVINVNNPLQIFSYFPGSLNVVVNEGDSIKFEIQARDIDLNTTFNFQWFLNGKLVSSSTVSGDGSKSSWIYSASYGDYSQKIVKILVSDGELQGQDYVQWKIKINDITSPAQPILNAVTSPTNISPQVLSGTKEANSSILINDTEVVSINSSTDWSHSYNLSEGTNNISISSRDAAGNESLSITANIILDVISPMVPTLNSIISPTNISTQILGGTKEVDTTILINGSEVISINSEATWSYSLHLTEGTNSIFITSCDSAGNESASVSTIIVLDTGAPVAPTLGAVVSPINISPQNLSGTKESNTSIWINNIEIIPINSSTNWTYDFNLSEGENDIFITSQDSAGNESGEVTAKIILDTISPIIPTLNEVIIPTNISSQILSGTKEINTSIWINEVEVISVNTDTTWSYSFDLSEGINNISITSRDISGNESLSITTIIILDTSAPEAPTLDSVVSPTNISLQTLSGTKETNSSIWINGVEVVSLNSSTVWSYSYNFSEGNNNISVTSRDTVGNESSAVLTTIEYDPNIYVDIRNTSGIEDGTQTHPFNSIIEGIDAVAPGKSVIVAVGTYKEQLIIDRSITLRGASRDNTFITGSGLTGNLITIEADHVIIKGFTINGGSSTSVGIYFDSYSSININNNTIQNNVSYGINYSNSSPTIENNNIKNNNYSGIDIAAGGAGIIRNNSLINNLYGIRSCEDSCPEINRNNISDNNTGIYCRESATPIISYNTVSNNSGYGILIDNLLFNSVNPDIGGGDRKSDGQNKITGNYIHGVSNKTTRNIYAKYNWWGAAAGPKYPYHTSSSGDWAFWSETGSEIIFTLHLTTEP